MGTWRPNVVFLARLLLASSRNHGEDYGNEKRTKCNRLNKQNKNSELAAGLSDRFLYRHHNTNVVKRHRSGNSAILAFISKIVVWLNGIVATSISSEIPHLVPYSKATELKFELRKHFNRQFTKPVLSRVILETSFHMMWVIFLDVTIAYVAKRVLDSGLHAKNSRSDSRYWIQDSLSVQLGFQSLVGFRIPWAVFRIPMQKFPGFRNPNSLTWGEKQVDK